MNRAWLGRRRQYPPAWWDELAPYSLTAYGRLLADVRAAATRRRLSQMRITYNRKRRGHR